MKKRYHIQNIFWHFLLSYLLLLIFPTIFSIIFYKQATDMAEKVEVESRLTSLQQVQSNLEHYLNSCNSLAVSLKYEMYKKNMPSFKKPEPGSTGLYQFIQNVEQFTDRYAFDGNTALKPMVLMKNDDMVFKDSSVIYGLEFFYNRTMNYSGLDYAAWYDLAFSLTEPLFIPSQDMKIDGVNTRALTYLYPLYTIGSTQDSNLMQFVLYDKDLQKILSMANTDNSGSVYLLQLDGVQLGFQGGNLKDFSLDVSRMEQDSGAFSQDFQDEKYFIIYSKSNSKNILLVSALPEKAVFSKTVKIKYTMQLAVLVYLGIGFAICFSFAHRNSKPIKNLSNNIRTLVNHDPPSFPKGGIKNEYDYLTHGIHQLAEKVDMTTRNAQENYLNHIFSGSGQVKSVLLQMGQDVGIDPARAGCYSVAIIRSVQRDFLCGVMTEYRAGKLSAPDEKGDLFFCATKDDQTAVLFLSSYDNHEAWTMKVLFDLYSEFIEPARIGLGKTYNDVMDIQFSYSQALYAISNADQEVHEGILTYEKIESTLNLLFYPIDLEYKLINWVKSGSLEELSDAFEQIHYQNFRCKRLTPRMFKLLTDNIQSTLLKIYEEYNMDETYEELVSRLNREENWEEKFGILKDKFIMLASFLGNRKNQRAQEQKHKFLTYIEEQYGNSMLCVAEMAREFDLSESYFSQLFKELTGDTFSAYLENLRINKACELMNESKTAEIEQVAQAVGYNNSNTFRRAFKRAMGIAPSSYKDNAAVKKDPAEGPAGADQNAPPPPNPK